MSLIWQQAFGLKTSSFPKTFWLLEWDSGKSSNSSLHEPSDDRTIGAPDKTCYCASFKLQINSILTHKVQREDGSLYERG